jgi:hypothetical protein
LIKRCRGNLRDVEQLRRRLADGSERVLEHAVAEWTSCADDLSPSARQFRRPFVADALAAFFA